LAVTNDRGGVNMAQADCRPWEYAPFFEVDGVPIIERLKHNWSALVEEFDRYQNNSERGQFPYFLKVYSGTWLTGGFRSNWVERSYMSMDMKRAIVRHRFCGKLDGVTEERIEAAFLEIWEEGLLLNRSLCPLLTSILDPLYPDAVATYSYSTMRPGLRIEPHRGVDDGNLRIHMCLREADNCFLTVRGQRRTWRNAQVWGFDDTETHSAQHGGAVDRTVIIVDFKKTYVAAELQKLAGVPALNV